MMPRATFRVLAGAAASALFLVGACAADSLNDAPPAPLDDPAAYAATLKLDGVSAATFDGVEVHRDLEYARYGDDALLLDFYRLRDRKEKLPCVIVVTGGGFRAGNKARFAPMAAYLAANGFAAACISYRGAPGDTFPTSVHDTKAAVRFVRLHADALGVDPERIGAFGQSAGGHLAVMLAVTSGVDELEGSGGSGEASSRIQAAVSFAGVFDFISRLRDGGHQTSQLETKRRTNGQWIGEPFAVDSETWRAASPINYVTPDDPPVLLVHCKADRVAPHEQSIQMSETMKSHGCDSRLLLIEGGGHGIATADAVNEQAWRETLAFFRETLGRP